MVCFSPVGFDVLLTFRALALHRSRLMSRENLMQANADKCKKLVIDFKKNNGLSILCLFVGLPELLVVDSAKWNRILGLIISCDHTWNRPTNECPFLSYFSFGRNFGIVIVPLQGLCRSATLVYAIMPYQIS